MTDRFVRKPFLCGVLVLLASVTSLAQAISSDPSVQGVDAYAIPFPRTARVVLDTSGWQPFAGGSSFGDVGPYEQLIGRAHLAFDPADTANAAITDLALAPRDNQGRVRATTDIVILRPATAGKSNRRLLVDVVNRGNPLTPRYFDDASAEGPAGNGFLMRWGYTVVQIGWQHDVPEGSGLRIHVPQAVSPDGGPVTGRVFEVFQTPTPLVEWPLKSGAPRPHLPDDPYDRTAELTVRESEDAAAQTIPRGRWSFSAQQYTDGMLVPDPSTLFMSSGFLPGRIYQVTYRTTGAPVVGMGLLAIRSVASFLRYGPAAAGNPLAGAIDYTYAYGMSQTARLLREFLYYALNLDEDDKPVFDGLILQGAGVGRGEFNRRFAQNNAYSSQVLLYRFPFTDADQVDAASGRRDGLLSRQMAKGGVPKIIHLHAGGEYWYRAADFSHTDVGGTADVEPPDQVRIYAIAGAQHSFGSLPLTDQRGGGGRLAAPRNIVDYRPVTRAALVNLDRWVSAGEAPPPAKVPRIADGTLVPPERVDGAFASLGKIKPPVPRTKLSSRIVAAWFEKGSEEGLVLVEAPPVNTVFVNLVSAVDADGNEMGGLRLPVVTVPVATHTGWNFRKTGPSSPDAFEEGVGASLPFPATASARQASGDPRRSIEERYASKEDYLQKVRSAAEALVDERYLLAEDVTRIVEQAGEAYDEARAAR